MSLLKQAKQLTPGKSLPISIHQYTTAKQYTSVLRKETGYYYAVINHGKGSFTLDCSSEPFTESLRSKLRNIPPGHFESFPLGMYGKLHATRWQMPERDQLKIVKNETEVEVHREA